MSVARGVRAEAEQNGNDGLPAGVPLGLTLVLRCRGRARAPGGLGDRFKLVACPRGVAGQLVSAPGAGAELAKVGTASNHKFAECRGIRKQTSGIL
jgi:hypothetical protein